MALAGAALTLLVAGSLNMAQAQCGLLGTSKCPSPQPASSPAEFPGYPNPGGSERTNVSVPPPAGKYFGFVDNSDGADWQLISPSDIATLSKRAGANATRISLDWRYLERTQDIWDEGTWNEFQRIYELFLARGIRPVMSIGFAPPWARDPGRPKSCTTHHACRYPPSRSMNHEWAEFAAEVARRFPGAAIEIWNEPNIPQFWRSGPDPERFAELQYLAYRAIKAVRPSTLVLAGGLNNNQGRYGATLTTGGAIPLKEFLEGAYAASPSIKHNMDALSFHTSYHELEYGAGSLMAKVFADVRSVKGRYGDAGRRLWITEAGLSTTGEHPRTEREQADGLLRQYRRFMTMPDVDAMLINALVELGTVPASNVNRGYGVRLHAPGYPVKLAYCAFSNRAPGHHVQGCPPLWHPTIPS
ncbi:MAG: cellulase family glycosylhydrolase, partial [Actinomycetota bacterium]|nr:cellulase family glycosylhydrolase [Actinomycetota bacterium]